MDEKQVNIDAVSIDDVVSTTDDATASTPNVIDELNAKIAELNDKYLRAVAELENTRRRAAIDADAAGRNRAMSVSGKILPVMDAIDAALKLSPDDAGIQSMAAAMNTAFAQIGISRIESVGQVLNPQFHNAIQVTPIDKTAEPCPAPNTIVTELQPGYMFGDCVLRTAMVIVCK